jgi:small subunit ribosomal protein S20
MPNIKSAEKRWRQNEKRRMKNRAAKSVLRTKVRKVRDAATSGDVATAESEFRNAAKSLDRAGARRTIHRNKAARLKSRLQHAIKKAKGLTPASTSAADSPA